MVKGCSPPHPPPPPPTPKKKLLYASLLILFSWNHYITLSNVTAIVITCNCTTHCNLKVSTVKFGKGSVHGCQLRMKDLNFFNRVFFSHEVSYHLGRYQMTPNPKDEFYIITIRACCDQISKMHILCFVSGKSKSNLGCVCDFSLGYAICIVFPWIDRARSNLFKSPNYAY